MKLQKVPAKRLKRIIRYFYEVECHDPATLAAPHHLIPDGTFEIMFNLGGAVMQSDGLTTSARPAIAVTGGFSKGFALAYGSSLHIVGAVIEPSFNTLVFNDRSDIYQGRLMNAEEVFGSSVLQPFEVLRRFSSLESKRDAIERWLEAVLLPRVSSRYRPEIAFALNRVKAVKGRIAIDALAKESCMSIRNFRRAFVETAGMSPKDFCGIVRAKHILHQLKKGMTLSDTAFRLGFHDPSHLIRDFKNISGATPGTFISNLNMIDESFIDVSDYRQGLPH